MIIFQKNLQTRIDKLFSEQKKDDVINFEELGVDALIVDAISSKLECAMMIQS